MPLPPAENRDLRSWKEIAEYLGITARTAQRYESELGLPIRRLPGAKGRIWSSSAELDAWREARAAMMDAVRTSPSQPGNGNAFAAQRSTRRPRGYAVLAAAAALCVVAAFCWWIFLRSEPVPAQCRIESSVLVVSDSMGKELWRRSFPEHLDHYSDPAEAVWIGDLDGDTRTDVVFNKLFTVEGINRSDLVCYSATGELKWTYTPGRTVTSPHQRHLSPDYHVFRFRVAPLDRRYPMNILTVSLHNTHFPTQVGLLSPDGNLIREYWHSGYITHIRLGDLDRNGRDEVYLGGVNNGSQCATVVVLDPEAMGGASVEENPDFGIEGFGPGREIARLLFPRSCINTNAKMPQSRNSVRQLRTSADRLFVDTMETREDGGATLNYTFDPAFRALEVLPADDFMRTHMALRAAGVLDHDFDKGELGPLHKVRVLRPGAGVDNAPSASH